MTSLSLLRAWTPPVLLDLFHRVRGRRLRFAGRPVDWHDATCRSAGYDAHAILSKVIEATRAVVSGRARFERDGVLFDEADYPFAVVTGLLRAAGAEARLNVIDFGGSLGSTYRQCRPLLDRLACLRWWVVEQPAFVAAGRSEFSTAELGFANAVAEVPRNGEPCVVLASSVLQYLQDPDAAIAAFGACDAHHLVIDRTPVGEQPVDRLCVQIVPRHIYAASYPCWIFSRERLFERLARDWRLVCEFPCPEGAARTDDGLPFEFRGFILERKA